MHNKKEVICLEKLSEDLLKNRCGYKAETISYVGNVSMVDSHYHEHYEILYVRKNSRNLTINNKDKYVLNENNIALIKPFLTHKTSSDENKKQRRSLINFSADVGNDLLKFGKSDILDCFEFPVIDMDEKTKNVISVCMDELSELDEESEFYEVEFKNILLKILIIFSKEIKRKNIRKSDGEKGVFEIIPDVAKRIQQDFSSDLSLEKLAEDFNISPCYLSRCFKEKMGTTLVKFINSIRIVEAQKLMAEGYNSVTAVAMQVGFSNITHFERVFKSIVGISPKKYMKNKGFFLY